MLWLSSVTLSCSMFLRMTSLLSTRRAVDADVVVCPEKKDLGLLVVEVVVNVAEAVILNRLILNVVRLRNYITDSSITVQVH
jgi:hypothetical protein